MSCLLNLIAVHVKQLTGVRYDIRLDKDMRLDEMRRNGEILFITAPPHMLHTLDVH